MHALELINRNNRHNDSAPGNKVCELTEVAGAARSRAAIRLCSELPGRFKIDDRIDLPGSDTNVAGTIDITGPERVNEAVDAVARTCAVAQRVGRRARRARR